MKVPIDHAVLETYLGHISVHENEDTFVAVSTVTSFVSAYKHVYKIRIIGEAKGTIYETTSKVDKVTMDYFSDYVQRFKARRTAAIESALKGVYKARKGSKELSYPGLKALMYEWNFKKSRVSMQSLFHCLFLVGLSNTGARCDTVATVLKERTSVEGDGIGIYFGSCKTDQVAEHDVIRKTFGSESCYVAAMIIDFGAGELDVGSLES